MKSARFLCLILVIKYTFKTMDVMYKILVLVYLNTYLEKLLHQAYYFNFESNQNSFFVKHIVLVSSLIRLLAWHIKFQKRKTLKKIISEELMQ